MAAGSPFVKVTVNAHMVLDGAYLDTRLERMQQDKKWGEQNHNPEHWLTILSEEHGEVARAILEEDGPGYRDELVQVAAVAIAAIESYDRGYRINSFVEVSP